MIWRAAILSMAIASPASAETLAENLADVLQDQIVPCLQVDADAKQPITVAFSLFSDGRIAGNVIHVDSTGGANGSDLAFVAVRRAILRCQSAGGYDMPPEHYGLWRSVRLTFDPAQVNE